jgi:hypothetical protein
MQIELGNPLRPKDYSLVLVLQLILSTIVESHLFFLVSLSAPSLKTINSLVIHSDMMMHKKGKERLPLSFGRDKE